jgi:hypothetical protein
MPTSTQLRATWYTDSQDMVVLQSTGDSRYHNCCIDGSTSLEYFRYHLVKLLYFDYIIKLVRARLLTSGTQNRWFAPGRSRRIFRAKIPQHAFLRRGIKAVCPMSHVKKLYNLTWKLQIIC